MLRHSKIIIFTTLAFLFFPAAGSIYAQSDILGQQTNFFIDTNYDSSQRDRIPAILQKVGQDAYFYVDKQWWESINQAEKDKASASIDVLDKEFHSTIYPTLISAYGLEWRPGIDKDVRITVLIHPMQDEAGGYFAEKDEKPRIAITNSNEREMVYLNSKYIDTPLAKSFLAHEFVHLITYNQKDEIRGISDDIWLNESRAEYASALCGYDSVYEGSNLQRRVNQFFNNPSDPLVEWQNISSDYGVLNVFIQYLVDHYGIKIISDSLHSTKTGVDSINYALSENGFKERFSDIFTNWMIAVLINDCKIGPKYCYLNSNLTNIRIIPQVNVLPSIPKSTLTISAATKNWAGNWYKIIGGNGALELKFAGNRNARFKVSYIVKDSKGVFKVNFLTLDKLQQSTVSISDFGTENVALYLLITIQNEESQAGSEPFYSFFWSASVAKQQSTEEQETIQKLLAQIEELKKEIARLQGQQEGGSQVCQISNNLYLGIQNNAEVKCLQEFLKSQGSGIYPEGLVTGNFANLTRAAVIRFQEKYASEILTPAGLSKGTGYVGSFTRQKINQMANG